MSNSEDTMQTKKKKTGLSLRTRLIIGVMLITGISIFILAYFSFQRRRELTNFITALVNQEVQQQSERLLTETVSHSSEDANHFFGMVSDDVQVVTDYLITLLNQGELLQTTDYWDAQEELTRFSENQWGNSTEDPGSIIAPSSFELTDETAAEINTSILLDLIAPQTLSANPNLKALYFVNDKGVTQYYPNIDLANIVGDFDARKRPYYRAVVPEINPEKESFWTVPYFDAADGSVVETHSLPVYDEDGNFRGTVAANVNITTVTDLVENIAVGETGYAFLIDPGGRFIVLPESALADFGLGPEALPEGGIAQRTIFDTEDDIRAFASKMISGETGLGTFSRNGEEHYFAYAPIEATGYSLGVVVPVAEMIQLYLTVQENVIAEENSTLQITIVIFVIVLLAALLFAYVIGRLLTRPLEQLTEAAEKVSGGNFDVEIDTSAGGEIGTLAVAFDDMTHQIQDLIGNLEQRVTDRTHALEASMDISRSLSTILDHQQLVSEVVAQVQTAFNYYHVHIYLTDPMSGDLRMAGGTGEAGKAMLAGGHKIKPGQGLVGKAAVNNELVLAPDVSQEDTWLPNPLLPDTKAETAVPISFGSDVLGVLDVQHDIIDGLTEDDTRTLQSIADQAAVALRNIRLYEQAQKQATQQATLNEINQRIRTTADIDSVLRFAAQEIGKTLNAKRISVQLSQDAQDNGRQVNKK